jgi:predicted O-methyltransferase YrrM
MRCGSIVSEGAPRVIAAIRGDKLDPGMRLKSLIYYGEVCATALPRLLYFASIGSLLCPRKALALAQLYLDNKDLSTPDPHLATRRLDEIFSRTTIPECEIVGSYLNMRSSDTRALTEVSALGGLMQLLSPKAVFEIGTFVGRTTRLLAKNAPLAQVFTLDLPQQTVRHRVGEFYVGHPEALRIVQLCGNSQTFDFSPWQDGIDFCWVDACHDYSCVVNDTLAALKIVKPGGWIGWHDYRHTAWWSGVTRAVREFARRFPGATYHLLNTTITLHQVSQGSKHSSSLIPES